MEKGIATPTINIKKGCIKSQKWSPIHSAWSSCRPMDARIVPSNEGCPNVPKKPENSPMSINIVKPLKKSMESILP
jgi:hypothetical protein